MLAVFLRLPDDIGNRLAILAERTGRSKSFYILEAVREHLDDLEDVYLAEAALERVRRGGTCVYVRGIGVTPRKSGQLSTQKTGLGHALPGRYTLPFLKSAADCLSRSISPCMCWRTCRAFLM